MTKKEFKEAMKRGLGRCVLELENTSRPEKYQDIVLWGCTRNLSYDVQSEGTRAGYIYGLIQAFPDKTPFLQELLAHFQKCRSNGGWKLAHVCRLLSYFAADGSGEALSALWGRYDSLYQVLWKRSVPWEGQDREENGPFPERDDFEELSIDLVDCAEDTVSVYLKIAEDMGRLYLAGSLDKGWDFSWFHDCCKLNYGEERIMAALEQRAGEAPAAAEFLKRVRNAEEDCDEKRGGAVRKSPQTPEEYYESLTKETEAWEARVFGRKISGKGKFYGEGNLPDEGNRRISEEKKLEIRMELAQRYLAERELWKRNLLLMVFTNKDVPFPLSPEAVIADARAADESLRQTAFEVLANIRHELVREFAFALLQEGGHEEAAIWMLARNYREEDKELFVNLIYGVPVSYGARNAPAGWHGIFSAVLDMFEEGEAENPPEELLPYLYETTLCSFCREYILEEMDRRHMVSEEMLRECLYDSNENIRNFAEGRLAEIIEAKTNQIPCGIKPI